MKKNILLLDAGGPGSIGTLKNIKESNLSCTTIACDMDEFAAGRLFADVFVKIPAATDPRFLTEIERVLHNYNIDLVLPTFHYGFAKLANCESYAFMQDF